MRRDYKEDIRGEYSIKVARSIEEVEEIRPIWEKMQCNYNTDIDIYLATLKFIEGSRPHVILLFVSGCPKTIMVGRLVDRSFDFKIGYKTLYSPKVRLLSIVYGGVVGEQSHSNFDVIISEIINSLSKGEADMAIMNCLRFDSDIYKLVKKKPKIFCRDFISDIKVHSKINLPGNINEFLQGMKPKHKYWIRRMYKLLKRENQEVAIRCFQYKEEVEQLCSDAESIAAKTYQRGIGTGFFYNNREKARRIFLAERGWLRGYVLYVNNNPCAFWIGSLYKGVFLSEFTGYDPDYKKYEPGTILLTRIIGDLCQSKAKELDFGAGEAFYKKRFGNQHWKETSVYIFAPTIKGIKLNLARTMTVLFSQFAERILNRFELLNKIKRGWRDYFIQRFKRNSQSG
jgi:hypothetical protein